MGDTGHGGEGDQNKERPADILGMIEVGEEGNSLAGLAETHLIGQDGVVALSPGKCQPVQAVQLVVPQLSSHNVIRLGGHLLHRAFFGQLLLVRGVLQAASEVEAVDLLLIIFRYVRSPLPGAVRVCQPNPLAKVLGPFGSKQGGETRRRANRGRGGNRTYPFLVAITLSTF